MVALWTAANCEIMHVCVLIQWQQLLLISVDYKRVSNNVI